jgi:hypothetical protein
LAVAPALEEIADDVVRLDRRAILNIAQHGGGERRAGRGEHVPNMIDECLPGRVTRGCRHGAAFVEKRQ